MAGIPIEGKPADRPDAVTRAIVPEASSTGRLPPGSAESRFRRCYGFPNHRFFRWRSGP
ncbi:MAG TPA: hypothetical protein VIA80_03115 [Hyphomonadaceae bacterium]|jgi:hypothetical protein